MEKIRAKTGEIQGDGLKWQNTEIITTELLSIPKQTQSTLFLLVAASVSVHGIEEESYVASLVSRV